MKINLKKKEANTFTFTELIKSGKEAFVFNGSLYLIIPSSPLIWCPQYRTTYLAGVFTVDRFCKVTINED